MPELPEVEAAAVALRAAAVGQVISRVRRLHASHQRQLSAAAVRRVVGQTITAVERRGKHQLIRVSGGATVVVHFRMTGDWEIGRVEDPLPAYARVVIELANGTRVTLVDMRALSTTSVATRDAALPELGPDPTDPAFTVERLQERFAGRRTPIKVALLDQRVVAGVGNIYASEALWRAYIDPRRPAGSLSRGEAGKLLRALRVVLTVSARHAYGETERFAVYDREGEPCRRCGTTIERFTQAGRSTYWCPYCQKEKNSIKN
ncbi:MAG TPA: bifunctional DNA-formamidopyrimidine glycosylase/DNA-(apurinic or apyrimidinic site) lyase [Gemmatimonadaceae bacterium]|jgi:formamidopyrimidine-DNA glycosylase|nr:bifunctional DNA-formamidopyrimidine glycosylase/DNA-(apurinic or apyrimidinic site) lyase [Gemmatimonadaceae bacterium]